jgi:hypothetical protein
MTDGDERVVVALSPGRDDATTMPVELIAFTADRRIRGAIPLADDRLSDMLNSVPRVVVRGALVDDLVNGGPTQTLDLTVAIGSIVAVLVTGRRGMETRRRRTDVHRARIGLGRFIASGSLHVPIGADGKVISTNPAIVLAGSDLLVPLTDATISYDHADTPSSEQSETILVSRTHATWIDLDDAAGDDDSDLVEDRPKVYHAAMAKDFTRAT